jgi:small subunit ribosomal protein S17
MRTVRRDLARIKTVQRQKRNGEVMAQKSEKVGVVVSNKMQKSIVVAVEWQVRDGLYGKTQRRTSKFMVHDEENAAKIGDTVAITETRPMSRRKRWALARVVRTSAQV